MCDYCDCRSIALLDRLGADHAGILSLGAEVRDKIAAGDIAEAREVLTDLLVVLGLHTAVEEAALFPALDDAGIAGVAADLVGEHEEIDRLATLAGATPDAGWPAAADLLLRLLEAHIRREEYDVFPAAMQLVPGDRWDAAHDAAARFTTV
jgi:hypothetical protein